jgi:hypothetical protein
VTVTADTGKALPTAFTHAVTHAANDRSVPNGIRTRVTTLKGWDPRPLDDGDSADQDTAPGAPSKRCYRGGAPGHLDGLAVGHLRTKPRDGDGSAGDPRAARDRAGLLAVPRHR